mmetsp:Transcript_34118/g.89712  ORF Transcript_34118/g.89712 Transcript_34118/m.89712 type:complete len:80 (-) Transcript_34118:201-440(-)
MLPLPYLESCCYYVCLGGSMPRHDEVANAEKRRPCLVAAGPAPLHRFALNLEQDSAVAACAGGSLPGQLESVLGRCDGA